MELARAGARAGVASVGGVGEAARAALLRVTGGPGGGAGCCRRTRGEWDTGLWGCANKKIFNDADNCTGKY